jgi:hypothetical protein
MNSPYNYMSHTELKQAVSRNTGLNKPAIHDMAKQGLFLARYLHRINESDITRGAHYYVPFAKHVVRETQQERPLMTPAIRKVVSQDAAKLLVVEAMKEYYAPPFAFNQEGLRIWEPDTEIGWVLPGGEETLDYVRQSLPHIDNLLNRSDIMVGDTE